MVAPASSMPLLGVRPSLSVQSCTKSAIPDKKLLVSENGETKISIWLLPAPQDSACKAISNVIETFSNRTAAASVPFEPHVTLVGGFHCPNNAFLEHDLIPKLQAALQKAPSKIPCQFSSEPLFQPAWNQAAVLKMEQSAEFTDVVQICRQVLSESLAMNKTFHDRDWKFPPPLGEPHLSLYYGMEGVPTKEEIVESLGIKDSTTFAYEASRVAIWKTSPSSTEGVAEWRELASIDLAKNARKSTSSSL